MFPMMRADHDALQVWAKCGHGIIEHCYVLNGNALIRPVVICVREHVENGRTYLHELVFGDPAEPYRREGLTLAARLEEGITRLLADIREQVRATLC